MYKTGRIIVSSVLPDKLSRLREIAYNIWWSWNYRAKELFAAIDNALWDKVSENPVAFLHQVSQSRLAACIKDSGFMNRYYELLSEFDAYMSEGSRIAGIHTAYFSAEYGLHHSIPIYSGGLGVLSGDHCKSASDLNLPFTAIGLFYRQGYFTQRINPEGWQETEFSYLNVAALPLKKVVQDNGHPLLISVEFPGRMLYAAIWQLNIGRIKLYLLDTDTDMNSREDRSLTARLYGGDHETRIQQELLLGIGGSRALDALGIKPTVYHMNEGHSAFLGLELLRKLTEEKGLSFDTAREACSSMLSFTTHTPVPAGNDVFHEYLIDRYLTSIREKLGMDRQTFMNLGSRGYDNNFNMTLLALKLSGIRNGVSELHGAVSRSMYNDVWPDVPEDEIPVTHITNGVHTLTWLSSHFCRLYDRYLPQDWKNRLHDHQVWEHVRDIPSEELWLTHSKAKHELNEYISMLMQAGSNGIYGEMHDPDALTIGFARRFATYKRADLIFRSIERLKLLMEDKERPVQIVFAGKAHPADRPAQEIIKRIHDISKSSGFKGKVLLIENYDMKLAKKLTEGVDVWLNNPRRPLEASGTSGQKVSINGIINFSVLDGWWCEGYNGKNGWVIGDDTFYTNDASQDSADSESIYSTLERKIIPLYYDRNEKGIPEKWVALMKESIRTITPVFSTDRMVSDYLDKIYRPLSSRNQQNIESSYRYAAAAAEWRSYIKSRWHNLSLSPEINGNFLRTMSSTSNKPVEFRVTINTGGIDPNNLKVEFYYGEEDKDGMIINARSVQMNLIERKDEYTAIYGLNYVFEDGGEYIYTFRLYPVNEMLITPFDTGFMKWIR